MARRLAVSLLLALVTLGCGTPLRDVQARLGSPSSRPPGAGAVGMTYLGNGGWLIRRGAEVIATAPFVSNPAGLRVYLPAASRPSVVDARVPAMPDVEIMLIGHAHYDHAMDLPHVLANQAPRATVYGDRTVKHLLGRTVGHARVQDVSGGAARGAVPGRWFPRDDAPVRFMPLASTHAPHLLGFLKIVSWGTLDGDLDRPPSVPAFWPEGEPLAFLIDFLGEDRGRVDFRIYYQDAASRPGTGILPALAGRDAAPIDVAILCVAGFSQVPDNPEHILKNAAPRHVVGGHWEDFFLRPGRTPARSAPGTSLDTFIRRTQAVSTAPIYMVEPGATLSFPRAEP